MSSIKTAQSVSDMVSICVFCREDASILMTLDSEGELAKFPSLKMIKTSWRLTVRKLISLIGGLSGKEISIMRITRFWIPEHSDVFHVIYKVKCPLSEKKVLKLQVAGISKLKWLSLDQVQQMSLCGQLSSPELLEYVAQTLQPRNFYPLTADPEASKEGFDMLNEVVEKNIIVDIDSFFLTPQEQLLKLAHFTKNEQKKLYREFWNRTFPNLLMNNVQFNRLMGELGWRKDDWPDLFSCADSSVRGGLSFRDFILFLAATDPDTPHGMGTAEMRCQYIFRYYDRNRDNALDDTELRCLVCAILSVKGAVTKSSELDKTVDHMVLELGVGPKTKLSLGNFIKKVGELKLRGTSSLFRSPTSALKLLPSPTSSENQPSMKETPTNSKKTSVTSGKETPTNSKKTSVSSGRSSRGWKSNTSTHSTAVEIDFKRQAIDRKKTFEIATHTVRLTRTGLVEEVRPIDRVSNAKSGSMGGQDHFVRMESLQYYDEKSAPNELLAALEYFTNEAPPKGKNSHRKQPFSWGKFDMSRLATLLMNVCEKCIHILEKEPRMVQIQSPAYILGDLHGNYPDLMVFEQVLWNLGISLSPCSLLFLGDYVDRGAFGVETVAYLFAQKAKNPNKVFIIRGNHEIRIIQKTFTFYSECQRKFGETQFNEVWESINKVFDLMPVAAVIDHKVFCCHGGIPSPWLCTNIEVINTIPSPLPCPEEDSYLAWEIMWNDPAKGEQMTTAISQEMEANEGFAVNIYRKTGRVFSCEALEVFLKRNNLSHVIRAHEVKTAGFQVQQGGKLLTVFSSSGYCGGPNEAACIFVSQEKIRVFRINTS